MTPLKNIGDEASLVLVIQLIAELENQRRAGRQPSLIDDLKAGIAQAWSESPNAAPSLRVGMADAQLVLEWLQQSLAANRDLHFGDLIAGAPPTKA